MKLTIIIPVFNEEKTVRQVVKKVQSIKLPDISKEIIVVNDGSTDDSGKILKKIDGIKLINKLENKGKGSAIRSALKESTGDIFIIQDADLEYNPEEYSLMLQPILDKKADVVFGSRLLSGRPHRVLYFWHAIGNNFLTLLSNIITNLNLSDMETCYKAFTKDVAKKLIIHEDRFGFEPEFTVKVAKMGARIFEVGISYSGRSYREGKKINWKDGLSAIYCLIKYA